MLNTKLNFAKNKIFSPAKILLFLLFLISFYIFHQFIKNTDFTQFVFSDSDCYMRLIRVKALYQSGAWFDNFIPNSNYPYGETLHWSRPLDLLLLSGAYIGMPFTDFDTALYWSGVFISPILYIAAIICVYWSVKVIYQNDIANKFNCVLIFVFNLFTLYYFAFGRPDHHSLLLLLFILQIGCCLRIFNYQHKYIYWTALWSALAMWISIEAIVFTVIILLALSLLCLITKDKHYITLAYKYTSALLGCLTLFYLLGESLSSDPFIVYDKLSLVHLFVFLLALPVLYLVGRISQTTSKGKQATYLLAIAAIILASCKAFPGLINPFADIDPRVYKVWLDNVSEVQPINIFNKNKISASILFLAPIIFSIPYCLRSETQLKYKVLFCTGIAIYTILSVYQNRWSPYLYLITIIPVAQFILFSRNRVNSLPLTLFTKTVTNALIILFVILGPTIISAKLDSAPSKTDGFSDYQLKHLNNYLVNNFSEPQVLLANSDFGAPILYNSPHKVIATAYHRNYSGILYFADLMSSNSYETAYAMLQSRNVDLIIISPTYGEQAMAGGLDNKTSFYNKLLKNETPSWLQKLDLPQELSSDFIVYRVTKIAEKR